MAIELSEHFSYKKLVKFVYPAVIMMVFTSVYGVVDGIFISNFAGGASFAAINLIMPVIMVFAAAGFMIGPGGSALISKILGEGDERKARAVFSLLVCATFALGVVTAVVGLITIRPIAVLLKADREGLLEDCVLYAGVCFYGFPLYMLQNVFQSFFALAGKPKTGLAVIVCAGITNAVLDAVFVARLKMGLLGAGLATIIGQAVGGLSPVVYFAVNRKGALYFVKPLLCIKSLLKACANGSSEMMTNLSLSLVNMLYNYQLINFAGKNGVAAYGVLMYVNLIFCSVYLGYSVAVTPIFGYHFGAGNRKELNNLLKKSLTIVAACAITMFALALALSDPLTRMFVGYDAELFALTKRGFTICASIFLVMGFNIFGSAFFTALNNGLISAVISFMRTLVFQIVCIMTLPLLFGLDGVWASNAVAECLALAVTLPLFFAHRKKYGYFIRAEAEPLPALPDGGHSDGQGKSE